VYGVQREPTPEGPGSGFRLGRKRLLCQLPLWFYISFAVSRTAWTLEQGHAAHALFGTGIQLDCANYIVEL
jgi:hypothetical protein